MALQLPPKPGERISQILPTVKCSTCGAPVSLLDLGDHICPPMPPPKPPTPRPSALLAKIRQASQAITVPGPIINSNRKSSTSPAPRSMTPLSVRSKTPQPGPASAGPVIPPPKTPSPAPSLTGRQRSSSISRGAPQLPPPQMPPPPIPANVFPQGVPLPPSRAGTPQISTSSPHPIMQRFDTFPRSMMPSNDGFARRPTEGSRRPSVASFADSGPARARVPSAPDRPVLPPLMTGQSGASLSPHSPVSGPPRTSLDRPPPQSARPSLDSQRRGSPFGLPTPQTPSMSMPMERPREAPVENMAGVGRRGFQAAAQAAMLAATLSRGNTPQVPTPGMDGRRTNAPSHLNIDADMLQRLCEICLIVDLPAYSLTTLFSFPSASASLSPNTPISSHSPRSPSPHSPHGFPPPSIASSRTPSPTSVLFPGLQRALSPKSPDTVTADDDRSPTPQNTRLSSRYNKKELEINLAAKPAPSNDVPPSPSDSDYSGSGLAYDQETESVTSPKSAPTTLPEKSNSKSRSSNVQFPSITSPASTSAGLPTRSASSASTYSYASRSTTRSAGALDTLFEGMRSPSMPVTPLSPATKSPKLPTRSRTTPALSSKSTAHGADAEASRRPKQCTRCSKTIDDGRWIKAEGAGVLCERCWKTMYLPKVTLIANLTCFSY